MTNIWQLDATAQAALVEQGEVHPRELVQVALRRIEDLNPTLNAVCGLDAERALQRAEQPLQGAFAGVPFLIKDLLGYPGFRHAFGSRPFAGNVATEATPYTERLDQAGLIVLGKTTTSELGLLGSTETALDGITRNPWDLERSAGGSSGGSAAAVASGMVPFAHASDGGGSIRLPAALCGLFGFKPSRGRTVRAVPFENDFTRLVSEHCVSRSVRDSARLLAVTGGEPLEPGLDRPLRIAVYRTTLLGHDAPPEGAEAVDKAIRVCTDLGHQVVEVAGPPVSGEAVSRAFFTVAGSAISGLVDLLGGHDEGFEPFTRALVRWYRELPPDALARAAGDIEEGAAAMLDFLTTCDVTLCPTVGVPPPRIGFLSPELQFDELIARTERFAGYTPIHNMAGAPAMSVPLHSAGVHFAARPGDDALLMKLAWQLEEAAPWAHRWPAGIS